MSKYIDPDDYELIDTKYDGPPAGPSEFDLIIHNIYDKLKNVIENPNLYDVEELSYILAEAEDDIPDKHGKYDGNYKHEDFIKDYNKKIGAWKRLEPKKDNFTKEEYPKKIYQWKKRKPKTLGQEIYNLINKVKIIFDKKEYGSDTDSTQNDETKSGGKKKIIKTRKSNTKKRATKKKLYYPTLLQQMKDNPWMKDILKKKANNENLSEYDKFLFNAMKQQPLPPGGITKLIEKYKKKK